MCQWQWYDGVGVESTYQNETHNVCLHHQFEQFVKADTKSSGILCAKVLQNNYRHLFIAMDWVNYIEEGSRQLSFINIQDLGNSPVASIT